MVQSTEDWSPCCPKHESPPYPYPFAGSHFPKLTNERTLSIFQHGILSHSCFSSDITEGDSRHDGVRRLEGSQKGSFGMLALWRRVQEHAVSQGSPGVMLEGLARSIHTTSLVYSLLFSLDGKILLFDRGG